MDQLHLQTRATVIVIRHRLHLRAMVAEGVTGEGKEEEGPMLAGVAAAAAVVVVVGEAQDLQQILKQRTTRVNRQCQVSLPPRQGIPISLVAEREEEGEAAPAAAAEEVVVAEEEAEEAEAASEPAEGGVEVRGEVEVDQWLLVFLVLGVGASRGLAEGGSRNLSSSLWKACPMVATKYNKFKRWGFQ